MINLGFFSAMTLVGGVIKSRPCIYQPSADLTEPHSSPSLRLHSVGLAVPLAASTIEAVGLLAGQQYPAQQPRDS
eukprot:COSAG06_NODE_51263_length_313_cov_0.864486_1_plen_74_part_01